MGENWTREKPTEETWYWYTNSVKSRKEIVYLYISSLSGKMRAEYTGGKILNVNEMNGWWAPATPPPFDGEDGE